MESKKEEHSRFEELQKKIVLERKSSWHRFNEQQRKEAYRFAEDYKRFMANNKTERQCSKNIVSFLKEHGFKEITQLKSLKTGDKFFKVVKNKTVIAAVVGKDPEQWRLVGSHMDSPRLDFKPYPFFEDSGLALMKTHYYGGVKKYHWVNEPLAMIGVVFTKSGKRVELEIGTKPGDPQFIIPDLLPHLAKNQMERKADKIIEGEELNILVGNYPIDDKKIKDQVKFSILKQLYEDYGLIEEDFVCAEIELVPVQNPVDIGFDKSMVGAYGQDDKVCVYTSLRALLEVKNPAFTALGLFVDKEEIGSVGDTGAASQLLQNFAYEYLALLGSSLPVSKLMELTKALSADVTAGMDPNYKDVHDPHNVSYFSYGVSVEKYGGGGGKFSTNDAHAEYMNYLRQLLDKHNIPWQSGELGKIDLGGGGTIAMYLSKYGMDCVDAGPCVLGMHAPCEVSCKADIYAAYLLYLAFFNE